jgi:hypothetical protein
MTSLALLVLVSAGVITDRVDGTRGVQATLLHAHTTGDLDGAQLTVGLNFVDGTMRGVQLAGLTNFAGDAAGVQLAWGWNFAHRIRGVQLAIAWNYADTSRGFQLGILNHAEDNGGAQLGFCNRAGETSGLQIGLINMSGGGDGETLGVLNFVRGGIHGVTLYTSDTMLTNVAIKLGGRHLYSAIIAAFDAPWAGVGLGVGWRAALGLGRLTALEIEASTIRRIHSLRAQLLLRLFGPLSVIAGGGANLTTEMIARVDPSFVVGIQVDP